MTSDTWTLPEKWRWVRLRDICEAETGVWGDDGPDGSGFPVVRSTEIRGYEIAPSSAAKRVIPTRALERYRLHTGDILVNKSSGSPHLVGWPAIFRQPDDGQTYLFSNFMLRLRFEANVLPEYALYYLHNPDARRTYLGAQDTTSGLRNLRIRDFLDQPFPLAPLDEQRRVVVRIEEFAQRIEEAKRLGVEVSTELSAFFPSHSDALLQELDSPVRQFGEVVLDARNGFGRRPKGKEKGAIVLRLADVSSGSIDLENVRRGVMSPGELATYRVRSGDLLFIRVNGSPDYIGRCVLCTEERDDLAFNDHLIRVRVDHEKIMPAYAAVWFNSRRVRAETVARASTSAGQLTINQKNLMSIPIRIPSLQEQSRIIDYLTLVSTRVEGLRRLRVEAQAELEAIFPSLLARAFNVGLF